jgi:hypothetical protein
MAEPKSGHGHSEQAAQSSDPPGAVVRGVGNAALISRKLDMRQSDAHALITLPICGDNLKRRLELDG